MRRLTYKLILAFLCCSAALAPGQLFAVEISNFKLTPEDGIISAVTGATESVLKIQFSSDTAVTYEVTGALRTQVTGQLVANGQATVSLDNGDFSTINTSTDLTLKVTELDSTATATRAFTAVVDAQPPVSPTGVRVLGTDGALIVAWSKVKQNTYDPANNVESYIVYYLDRDFTSELVTGTVLGGNIDSIQDIIGDEISFTQGLTLNGLKNGQTYWVTVVAVDPAGNRSGVATEDGETPMVVRSEPINTLSLTELAGFTDHCFLATAVIGDRDAWPLRTLRGFRDRVLFHIPGGSQMVAWYYRYGPAGAAWIYQHPTIRIVLTPLVWALAGMIFLVPFGLLLLLGLRFRRFAASLLLVLLLSGTARADFRYQGWLEMGAFKPAVSVFSGGNRVTYEDMYGAAPGLMTRVGWAWQITRDYGIPALGIVGGFWQRQGHPLKSSSGAVADYITSNLTLVPVELEFQYAFQYWDPQYIVPVLAGGASFWGLEEAVGDQRTQAFVTGWYWRAELRFLMDWMDPQLAMDFREGMGVQNTHLVFTWRDDHINDFGRRKQFTLSDQSFGGAILLEF